MIKSLLFISILFSGIFFSDLDMELNNQNICVESNFNLDTIMLIDNDDHNCEHSESPIWTVTYKSDGTWECSSDGRVQCFPCNTDPEEHP